MGGHLLPQDDKKVIGSNQRGFTEGTSCWTSLIAFFDETTTWLDEGRAVDIYLDFSVALIPASHNIGNKLNSRSQRIVIRV